MGLAAFQVPAQVVSQSLIDPQSLLGPQSLSQGASTSASNLSHDALFQNPASAAFQRRYTLNFGYLGAGDSLTASIVDTKSGPLGGGLFYLRRDLGEVPTNESAAIGSFARLEERAGFSLFGKMSDQFAIGTNIKYGYRRDYSLGVGNISNWNFDVGARFQASAQFSLGIVGQNLLTDTSGVHPRVLSAAIEFKPAIALSVSGQVSRYAGPAYSGQGTSIGYGLGAEYLLPYGFAARGGYRKTSITSEDFVGMGLGYDSNSFGVHYSFESGLGKTIGQTHSLVVSGYL